MSETTSPEDSPGLLSALLRFWWVALLGGLFGLFVANAAISRIDESFEASTQFTLDAFIPTTSDVRALDRNVSRGDHLTSEATLLQSEGVRNAAANRLPGLTAEDIDGRISLGSDPAALSLTLTATGPTGQEAADIANAYRDAYQEVSSQTLPAQAIAGISEVDSQIQSLEAQSADLARQVGIRRDAIEVEQLALNYPNPNEYSVNVERAVGSDADVLRLNRTNADFAADLADLELRRTQLESIGSFGGYVLTEQTEAAVASTEPTQPKPTLYRLLGAVAGLGLGAIVASWLTEQLPKAEGFRAIDAAHKAGQPMLVELTGLKDSSKVVVQSSKSPNSAAYEDLLFSTLYRIPVGERSVITVAGPEEAPGPSVATNMALAAARKELSVVLIDADIDDRTLSRAAQVNERPGLINLGAGDIQADQCVVSWSPGGGQAIDFIGAGTGARGTGTQFFRSADFTKALDVLAENYDLILLNGPQFPGSGHVQALSRESSFTVLAVNDSADDADLELVRQRANLLQGNIAGLAVSHHARPWWRPASVDALLAKVKNVTKR